MKDNFDTGVDSIKFKNKIENNKGNYKIMSKITITRIFHKLLLCNDNV